MLLSAWSVGPLTSLAVAGLRFFKGSRPACGLAEKALLGSGRNNLLGLRTCLGGARHLAQADLGTPHKSK